MCVCAGDDKATRKGQVLTLLAEQALQCLDFKTSYIHCQDLMAAGMLDVQISADFMMGFMVHTHLASLQCPVLRSGVEKQKQRWCFDFAKMGLPEAKD